MKKGLKTGEKIYPEDIIVDEEYFKLNGALAQQAVTQTSADASKPNGVEINALSSSIWLTSSSWATNDLRTRIYFLMSKNIPYNKNRSNAAKSM